MDKPSGEDEGAGLERDPFRHTSVSMLTYWPRLLLEDGGEGPRAARGGEVVVDYGPACLGLCQGLCREGINRARSTSC